ncbi:MAG: hypothetical protein KGJ13_09015 [Patescibacteria group bacterium]|nr:hypothetical protein [Patescibacteria group bacterium]
MTDVADKAGTSLTCLVKWKRKHTPTIEKFEKAANAIGYELKMMPREGESMGTQKLEKLVRFQLEFSAPNGKTEQLELYLNHEQIEDGYVCDVPSAPNDSLKITKIRVSVVSSLVGETVG